MRQAFAHDAVIEMPLEGDTAAPGAAITVALCGHWEHEPPCPLAPHYTSTRRTDIELHVRVLFATEPELEHAVRQRIDGALAHGEVPAVDGVADGAPTRWRLRDSRRGVVSEREAEHASRLIQS